MGSNERTVAMLDFVLDAEGGDVAALIDAIEQAGYHVDWLVNGDDDEPDAYIVELEEGTTVEFDQVGVGDVNG